MKVASLLLSCLMLDSASAVSHKHHKKQVSRIHKEFIQLNLEDNQAMLAQVHSKIEQIKSLVEVEKMDPSCDSVCQAKCDQKADSMIRELKNPLHDITWNCKNNYDVYTSDYDPEHSHFDRISMDVMATQRTLN